jgi:dTDP-4-dehydrorhamnose reductase
VRPAIVVNTAAWTAVDAAEDHPGEAALINETGARTLAAACRAFGSRLAHISTDYVFDGSADSPIPEDAACNPRTVYGHTKRAGEIAVLEELGDLCCVVRTAWLYSEYGSNFAKTMMRRALAGAPVSVVDDQIGQPTSAHDLARHAINLMTSGAPHGIYHGTNSGRASWYEFAQSIYTLAGADMSLVSATDSSNYPTRATRPRYSVLSHTRTLANGVEEMRPWRDALAASVDAVRDAVRSDQR